VEGVRKRRGEKFTYRDKRGHSLREQAFTSKRHELGPGLLPVKYVQCVLI
jgi:hypothetical protein